MGGIIATGARRGPDGRQIKSTVTPGSTRGPFFWANNPEQSGSRVKPGMTLPLKSPGIDPKVGRNTGCITNRNGPGPFEMREKGVNTPCLPHDGDTGR